jgi:hypothetical protein
MTGQVALIREQGQDFAVLAVKPHVIANSQQRQEALTLAARTFGVRTALLGEDGRTWGPTDIVRWLSNIDIGRLPWRGFTI